MKVLRILLLKDQDFISFHEDDTSDDTTLRDDTIHEKDTNNIVQVIQDQSVINAEHSITSHYDASSIVKTVKKVSESSETKDVLQYEKKELISEPSNNEIKKVVKKISKVSKTVEKPDISQEVSKVPESTQVSKNETLQESESGSDRKTKNVVKVKKVTKVIKMKKDTPKEKGDCIESTKDIIKWKIIHLKKPQKKVDEEPQRKDEFPSDKQMETICLDGQIHSSNKRETVSLTKSKNEVKFISQDQPENITKSQSNLITGDETEIDSTQKIDVNIKNNQSRDTESIIQGSVDHAEDTLSEESSNFPKSNKIIKTKKVSKVTKKTEIPKTLDSIDVSSKEYRARRSSSGCLRK